MSTIDTGYFTPDRMKKDARSSLIGLAIVSAIAGMVLVLQSIRYVSSILVLLQVGHEYWWGTLGMMLSNLATWALIVGVLYAMQSVIRPSVNDGKQFLTAALSGFAMGFAMPFLLVLGTGVLIYIPLGLFSLFVDGAIPYATLQFAWLMASYIVFIWVIVGMPPLLISVFKDGKWYLKLLIVLLFCQLTVDVLQSIVGALQIVWQDSLWQIDEMALILAVFGTLLVTVVAVLWSLRGRPALTLVYAISGIYFASIVIANFSDRLFHWGEVPATMVALVSPLVYLQVTKRILQSRAPSLAGLAAALTGVLIGLLVDQAVHLRTGGLTITLGLGLAMGLIIGPWITGLLSSRILFNPKVAMALDIGFIFGIMSGMVLGVFLAK